MNPFIALGIPSGPDLFFICIIVVLLFGAKKLPEFARGLGQSLGEFKKAKEEFEQELHRAPTTPATPVVTTPVEPTAQQPLPAPVPQVAPETQPQPSQHQPL